MVRLIASLVSKKINKRTKKQTNRQHFYWQGLVANFPRVIILDQIRPYKLMIMTYGRWKFYPSGKISYFFLRNIFHKLINDALEPFDSTNVDIYVLWHREHISFFVLVSRNITQVGVKFHCDQILNSNNLSKILQQKCCNKWQKFFRKKISERGVLKVKVDFCIAQFGATTSAFSCSCVPAVTKECWRILY